METVSSQKAYWGAEQSEAVRRGRDVTKESMGNGGVGWSIDEGFTLV